MFFIRDIIDYRIPLTREIVTELLLFCNIFSIDTVSPKLNIARNFLLSNYIISIESGNLSSIDFYKSLPHNLQNLILWDAIFPPLYNALHKVRCRFFLNFSYNGNRGFAQEVMYA
jgi:hypothetical protein